MEIIHYCNSFISIKINKTTIACDPWVGKTNDNAWLSYPIYRNGLNIINTLKPDYIYISHLHCDHFDPDLLKKCNKNIIIIIKKFKDQRLQRSIKKLGFKKILEYLPWKKIKLNPDMNISIIPQITNNSENEPNNINYDLDTAIIVQSNLTKKIFFNNVDNPLNVNDYKYINTFVKKKFRSKIHVSCMPVGSASEYPQCFLNINRRKEKVRVIKQCLSQVKKKLKIIKPEVFFPAGGSYIISGKYSSLNNYIARPNFKAIKERLKIKNCKIVDIQAKQKIIINSKSTNFEKLKFINCTDNKKNLKKKFSKSKYEYQKILNKYSMSDLDKVFNISVKNYKGILNKMNIKSSWTINLYLYKNLRLNKQKKIDYNKSHLLKKYELTYNSSAKKNYSELCGHLDVDLFYKMLNRIHPWNPVLSGSMVLFERKPNVFNPDVPFSLNFLGI